MAHELRKLMASADYGGPLGGGGKHVEVDETLSRRQAAQARQRPRQQRSNKTIVFGMVERDGMLRAGPVPDDTKFTLEPIILENVIAGQRRSPRDGHMAYGDLELYATTTARVNHAAGRVRARHPPHKHD